MAVTAFGGGPMLEGATPLEAFGFTPLPGSDTGTRLGDRPEMLTGIGGGGPFVATDPLLGAPSLSEFSISPLELDKRVTLPRRLTGGGVLEDARSLPRLGVSGMMSRFKGRLIEASRSCEKEGCRHSAVTHGWMHACYIRKKTLRKTERFARIFQT